MKYFYIPIAAFVLILAACKDKPVAHQETSENPVQTERLQITLNDGRKWQMDDHTRLMIKTMTERVEAGGDAEAIGKGLKSDLDELIQGCTMTGEAHDQLHAFLTVYVPAVQGIAANPSDESLRTVEGLLQEYPNYFE